MKIWITAFLMAFSLISQAQAISFIDNDWNKARTEAKSKGKYLFVDAYTDWCYWCKVMDKQTFPDKEVAQLINSNFVALKLEMEHNYGIEVAMKYRVNSFPSFLIFSPDGKLVRRLSGYLEIAPFMAAMKETLNPVNYPGYSGISETVPLNFPDFYKKAFGVKENKQLPDAATVNQYLDSQTDFYSEVNYSVMTRFAHLLSETHRGFLFDNRKKYEEYYGPGEIDYAIGSIANSLLQAAIKNKSEDNFQTALAFQMKYNPGKAAESKILFSINFYKGIENWSNMAAGVDAFILEKGYDGSYLNDWSWTVYEKCGDAAVVQKAIGWMRPVIDQKPEYASMDTYAALLYKNKHYAEAKLFAKRAIELGKKTGEKTDETEALLKKIESAK